MSNPHSLFAAAPKGIIEPDYDPIFERNLIHWAAAKGNKGFLSHTLIIKNDNSKDWAERQRGIFFALLAKDAKGKTPLALALENSNTPAAKVILDSISRLFDASTSELSREHRLFSLPFTKDNEPQEVHLQEHFDVKEICEALDKMPDIALSFVAKLKLVQVGDPDVQGDVEKIRFYQNRRLVTGSDERVPKRHWLKNTKVLKTTERDRDGEYESDPEHKQATSTRSSLYRRVSTTWHRLRYAEPVVAKLCPIKNIAAKDSKFLKKLVRVAQQQKKNSVFENEVVMSIVQFKWESYVKKYFRRHMYLDIIMVVCMTIDALAHRSVAQSNSMDIKIAGYAPMVITLCLWVFFVKHEAQQISLALVKNDGAGLRHHFSDTWNILDTISLSSIFAAYSLRLLEFLNLSTSNFLLSTSAMAFALPFTWINTLYYMQGFDRKSGELVRMIIGIVTGTATFLLILIVCMLGFAASFFILFEGMDPEDGEWTDGGISPPRAVLHSWTVMLAGFTVSEIQKGNMSFGVSAVLFVIFTYFINM